MLSLLADMQEKEDITWKTQFKGMKPNTFSKRYTALHKKHGDVLVIAPKQA